MHLIITEHEYCNLYFISKLKAENRTWKNEWAELVFKVGEI